ncbi:MAG: serine hydrolase [Phenylobacterium sp.]|nr:MAG: serine hydrolase [Phenylobacterium sp.]
MTSRVRGRMRKGRFLGTRGRVAVGVGVVALVAAAAAGWVADGHQILPEHATLTSTRPIGKLARLAPPAPPPPAELQATIAKLAETYREPVGIAVTDVSDRWTAQVAGSEVFPQQSVSKLWVALTVFQAVDRHAMTLDQPVVLTPDDRSVFYQPLASRIRGPNGYATTVYDLLRRQLTESDNAANDKLIREVGGGGAVDRTLAEKGLAGLGVGETERDLQTRAAGLTWRPEYGQTWIFKQAREQLPDAVRDAAISQYLANPPDGAKPMAITESLAALKRGELLSPGSTEAMLGLMGEAKTGLSRLRAGLPAGWSIAHKTGTGPDWRGASVGINDVGLVTAPDGRSFAVAVMMRETRKSVPARLVLFQRISRAIVDYWRETPATPPDQRMASAGGGALLTR